MTTERQFATTADSHAVNGGYNRFRHSFNARDDLDKEGFRTRLAKFADVGTATETASRADDDNGLYLVLGACLLQCLDQSDAHRVPERIDRWIVQRDDRNASLAFVANFVTHRWSLPFHSCQLKM